MWGCFGSSFGYWLYCRWGSLCHSSWPGRFNFGWWWGRGWCSGWALRCSTRWRGTWGIFEVSWERWGTGACCGPLRRSSCLHQHKKKRQETFQGGSIVNMTQQETGHQLHLLFNRSNNVKLSYFLNFFLFILYWHWVLTTYQQLKMVNNVFFQQEATLQCMGT